MAHDPSLGYADYFAAGSAGATLVPEVDAGDQHELYGVGLHHHHQPTGVEMSRPRGFMAPIVAAAVSAQGNNKDALVHDDASYGALQFFRGEQQQQQHRQLSQAAPLSLSLHGPPDPDAASFMLHHQLSGGDVTRHRQQHQQTATATWLQGSSWHLGGSRFLLPTQQLLQEFCSIPAESTNPAATATKQQQALKHPAQEDGGGSSSSATSLPPTTQQIQTMDAAKLQRLKAKLYTMLEEVDRRYRRYREQMRAVAGSFEAVAGERAAAVYTRMASRTISRHFRSLRDGVAAQVRAVRRKLGEKDGGGGGDTAAPGVTKGETPRLRALDQRLRQHKAYQSGMLEPHPWRPQRGLPERAVSVLRAWLFEHFLHPYPSDVDKHILARQTGLSRSQVSNWFINARVRLWKPMVEEMYAEEMKDKLEEGISGGGQPTQQDHDDDQVQNPDPGNGEDQKPTRAQLLHDAGSLASVVSIGRMEQQQGLGFGMMDHLGAYGAYAAVGGHQHGFGNGGVSLTLGLQHAQFHADPHHRVGVNVAFAPASPSSSSATVQGGGAAAEFLFMPGEHQIGGAGGMHSAHGGQYVGPVFMEGADQHYRGLSGATGFHLLRDLAG